MDTLITAKAALLQALVSGPSYGLELIERVRERTGGQVELGQGSVYPALRGLEREGLVEGYEGEDVRVAERGGRPRRHYRLTDEGVVVAGEQRDAVLGLFCAGGKGAQEVSVLLDEGRYDEARAKLDALAAEIGEGDRDVVGLRVMLHFLAPILTISVKRNPLSKQTLHQISTNSPQIPPPPNSSPLVGYFL